MNWDEESNRRRYGGSVKMPEPDPVFYAPLSVDGVDIVGGLVPTVIRNAPTFSSDGADCRYNNTSVYRGLRYADFPAINKDKSFTVEYEAKNSGYYSLYPSHNQVVEFGSHGVGQCLGIYSPKASQNNILLHAYGSGLEIYYTMFPEYFTSWRKEKLIWDADLQDFIFKIDNKTQDRWVNGNVVFVTAPQLGFNIGCSNYGSDAFDGWIRHVKIWNEAVY
jgi:hypothetical protein